MEANSESTRQTGRDIALFLIIAFLMRAVLLALVPRVIDSPDAVHYLRAAGHIAEGSLRQLDPKIPILYPAAIALVKAFVWDSEWAGRIASLLASTLLIVPVYLLSRDLHGRRAAQTAALLVATWPWLIDYGSRISTEALAVTLWVFAVWSLAKGLSHGARWTVVSAVAFFALHLTRPEGTFLLFAAFPAAFILCAGKEKAPFRTLIPFSAVCFVLLACHAYYMKETLGFWTLNYRVGFIGHTPEGSTVLADFVKTLRAMLSDVPAIMLGPLLWLFAGVGLFHPSEEKRDLRLEAYLIFFALVQWCVVLPNLSPAPRYLMASLVVVLLWSARGITQVSRMATQQRRGTWLGTIPLVMVLGLFFFHLAVNVGSDLIPGRTPRAPREYKLVGVWMKANLDRGLIMTRKPQVGYYAGMESIGPGLADTMEDVLRTAREGNFRYLVVDERNTARMVGALAPLLNPANAPSQLKLVADDLSPYANARVAVYEFVFPPWLE